MRSTQSHARIHAVSFVALISVVVRIADCTGNLAQGSEAYPALSGAYRGTTQHPRVFMSQVGLDELNKRINVRGSFSAQNFVKLSNQLKADVAANVDWDAAYSGCDLDVYLHAFSHEPMTGYANEIRTAGQAAAAMNLRPGMSAPAGAAIVASRLALYAALVKAGAKTPAGAPSAAQAAALATRILLAWATHGFHDQRGRFLNSAEQTCDSQRRACRRLEGKIMSDLQIARERHLFRSIAQDLLQSVSALDETETNQLNGCIECDAKEVP